VDGRSEAKIALQEAIRAKKNEDKLIVVHFVDSEAPLFIDYPSAIVHTPEEVEEVKERVYEEAKELTLQYQLILEANKVSNVELILMPCVRPQARAVKFVGDVGAEVVFVGTHNLGPIARTILGSFSHYILHNTQGCVVVAREKPRGKFPGQRLDEARLRNNLAGSEVEEDDKIDGFLLVGPPSLD
jgi:nucleotide-binding universal stress UspA family protein